MVRAGFRIKVFYVVIVLFIATAFLITFTYTNESWFVSLEDIPPSVVPSASPKEPALQKITINDSSETVNVNKVPIDYYIIVGSFKNLIQAQQRAEKLTNDFNTNIIVLPPAPKGYYRISFGKYSTHKEAESIIKSVRTNISSDAWIFSVKN